MYIYIDLLLDCIFEAISNIIFDIFLISLIFEFVNSEFI
jgi:hypothetical protein